MVGKWVKQAKSYQPPLSVTFHRGTTVNNQSHDTQEQQHEQQPEQQQRQGHGHGQEQEQEQNRHEHIDKRNVASVHVSVCLLCLVRLNMSIDTVMFVWFVCVCVCLCVVAIDMTPSPVSAVDTCIALGVDRILTSGGAQAVWDGRDVVKQMVERAKGKVGIIAGAGVTGTHTLPRCVYNVPRLVALVPDALFHSMFVLCFVSHA